MPAKAKDHSSSKGWAGSQLWGGWGVDTALSLDPSHPKKGLDRRGLQNPTETDPPGPGGLTRPQKSAKHQNGILESACRGGSEKSSFAMYLVGKKNDHFQCSQQFSAPSAPEFTIPDYWSCQLSPFPEPPPPPPSSIDPLPKLKIRLPKTCFTHDDRDQHRANPISPINLDKHRARAVHLPLEDHPPQQRVDATGQRLLGVE